jgi:hypothetical protein
MKLLKYILPALLAFSMAGCLDIDETIEVKKDGSGKFAMDMDMSQMVDLLQTYMGKEEMAKKGMEKMDTTIYMKDLVDTMSNMSAEKKALLRPGSVHIKFDADAKVFTTHMSFPYKTQAELQQLYNAMSDGSLGTTRLFRGMAPGGGGSDDALGGGNSPDINQFNGIYDFTSKDGLMTKRLNPGKFKALQNDPQMAQMKQASQMGVEINYTSSIVLPRPVKKVDNPLAKLSEDRKTVTIKYNLIEVFDHPEKFNYNIEY